MHGLNKTSEIQNRNEVGKIPSRWMKEGFVWKRILLSEASSNKTLKCMKNVIDVQKDRGEIYINSGVRSSLNLALVGGNGIHGWRLFLLKLTWSENESLVEASVLTKYFVDIAFKRLRTFQHHNRTIWLVYFICYMACYILLVKWGSMKLLMFTIVNVVLCVGISLCFAPKHLFKLLQMMMLGG